MPLSKSKCWYSNNCLHSLKYAVSFDRPIYICFLEEGTMYAGYLEVLILVNLVDKQLRPNSIHLLNIIILINYIKSYYNI